MRKVVFTIVAKNYIGLAGVLQKSVLENAETDFYVFVSDESKDTDLEKSTLHPTILWAREKLNIEEYLWYQMAFKYNLVEFCTAIKPFCFEYLANELHYSKIIYLDPDVYVFNSLEKIFTDLDAGSVMVTPHITNMHPIVTTDHPDYLFLLNGTFNLGFAAIHINERSLAVLDWWKRMLINECFFDNDRGTATDQKWMNLLPGFLGQEELIINRDIGLNVAPWNFHEREIITEGDSLFVTSRGSGNTFTKTPLIFVHFSGYDYRSFSTDKVVHKNEVLNNFQDFTIVFEKYGQAIAAGDFSKFSGLPYTYNSFENGKNILNLHRRLYRRMLEEKQEYGLPFVTSEGSFYNMLRRKKLIDYTVTQADKITGKTLPGFTKKLGMVNFMARVLKRVAGIRRYTILTRFLRRYLREENQYFLIDKEAGKKLW
jgi:hypothetical protein